MYWLKPFDCVNDAANAAALLRFDWSKQPVLEVGGGDGVFSFIMHKGVFDFTDDRYKQADTRKQGDIYDVFDKGRSLTVRVKPSLRYDLGVDLKLSHLLKGSQLEMYKDLAIAAPESLPLKNNSFGTVFLYTLHGLTDYEKTLEEVKGVIKKDGTLLMIAVNDSVRPNFVCFNLFKYFEKIGLKRIAGYFRRLDCGRRDEIGGVFSKSFEEWKAIFAKNGFRVETVYSQVSPVLWRIYDTQTRPFLHGLIHLSRCLERLRLLTLFKLMWMCAWFPLIACSYYCLAQPRKIAAGGESRNVFLAIKASLF